MCSFVFPSPPLAAAGWLLLGPACVVQGVSAPAAAIVRSRRGLLRAAGTVTAVALLLATIGPSREFPAPPGFELKLLAAVVMMVTLMAMVIAMMAIFLV